MLVYRPKYFQLHELVHEHMYHNISAEHLWMMLDARIVRTLDLLRERYGKGYVNNWFWGGNNQYSGLRPRDSSIGAPFSMHKFGRAMDAKFYTVPAEEIRQDILNNAGKDEFSRYITRMESDVDWLHFDTGNHNNPNRIILFKP